MKLGIQISAEEGATPQELVLPFKRVVTSGESTLKLF